MLFTLVLKGLKSRDFSFLILFFLPEALFSSFIEVNNFIFLVSEKSNNLLLLFLLKTFISPSPNIFILFMLFILLFFIFSIFLSLLLEISFWGTDMICIELSSEYFLGLIFPDFDSSF